MPRKRSESRKPMKPALYVSDGCSWGGSAFGLGSVVDGILVALSCADDEPSVSAPLTAIACPDVEPTLLIVRAGGIFPRVAERAFWDGVGEGGGITGGGGIACGRVAGGNVDVVKAGGREGAVGIDGCIGKDA